MQAIDSIHPFPARMAPDLALEALATLETGSHFLDPMAGSGTGLIAAARLGHSATGFDLDPMSVLLASVWASRFRSGELVSACTRVIDASRRHLSRSGRLSWIDEDDETRAFTEYWFGPAQREELRSIAQTLRDDAFLRDADLGASVVNALRVGLSRIIVTKESCASLARDTSHSRPHKVCDHSNYDVYRGFLKSCRVLDRKLSCSALQGTVNASIGDARQIQLDSSSVDAIVSSPPYLNAIDYLRGHKFALVWFGYKVSDLRAIRSTVVGAERRLDGKQRPSEELFRSLGNVEDLPKRFQGIVERYVFDLERVIKEAYRVLRPGATATYVVANSFIRGVAIDTSNAMKRAADSAGFLVVNEVKRELPKSRRYLPFLDSGNLSRRMRAETVLSFHKPTGSP